MSLYWTWPPLSRHFHCASAGNAMTLTARAASKTTKGRVMADEERGFYGVQFHPEVTHTLKGRELLDRFVLEICGAKPDWVMGNYIDEAVARIREQVGDDEVILGLSGGVDSSVAAALIHKAIGDQLTCVFVDHGLLRQDEGRLVMDMFTEHRHMKVIAVDASERFLGRLAGVADPEAKRKIIGSEFVEVFTREAAKLKQAKWLAQEGGIGIVHKNLTPKQQAAEVARVKRYESGVLRDPITVSPEMTVREVIALAQSRGISGFPVLQGKVVVGIVTNRDLRFETRLDAPVKDIMTADWAELPYALLKKVSTRIINEVRGINRVTYDVSSKPPATIEWE